MDDAGFHARRRADREARAARKLGKLGGLGTTQPLDDRVSIPDGEGTTGYEVPGYRPPAHVDASQIPGASSAGGDLQGAVSHPGPGVPIETAARKMRPHLQVMCGPMLRYDTVTSDNVYHAFVMIVTADEGSDYAPAPELTVEWSAVSGLAREMLEKAQISDKPTDPLEGVHHRKTAGVKIFSYHSLSGGNSFWRFKIEVPLAEQEEEIFYSLNGGAEHSFWVPAINQNMRWVAHSCNGFSSGVDTAAFNGPSPLWNDVLRAHQEKPVHLLVGGGDQIYCDPIAKEPELSEWINGTDMEKKAKEPLTDEMRFAMDRFFFNHYCSWFRQGAFGKAIAQIPMLNILDDHDVIDGFGSYDDNVQSSAVFSTIGARGYFWFLLFQMFIVDEVDGTNPTPGSHSSKSVVWGGEGAWIPFPNRSYLSYLGPKVYILLLDCRSERKRNQICSKTTYDNIFAAIRALPSQVEHLVMLLGVPIAYPRMTALESILDKKYNPMTILAKTGILSSAANKFNGDAELLDDMNDHWCAGSHKPERNWLIEECQKAAVESKLRISFLSGDVHAAAVSKFFSKKKVEPRADPKYMLQIITSAIVNTPPPPAVILLVSTLGRKKHKTLHHCDTEEELVEMFKTDTDGSKLKQSTVMGRRNYAIVEHDDATGELDFALKIEISQGSGTTKTYAIRAPGVGW